jgi:GNAT superfamily N-acetyltransferase
MIEPAGSSFRIRRARPGDQPEVAALLDEAQALHADLQPRFFRAPAGGRAPDPDAIVLVAEDEQGGVAGVAVLRRVENPTSSWMRPARRMLVEDLVVHVEKRRRGCARSLLAAAAAEARRAGASQLVLTLWQGNPAAERLYESVGFCEISRVLGKDV